MLTLARFLLGHADAIRSLAQTPWLWLAAVPWVLAAGLARSWDSEDLLKQPWHVGVGIGVSAGIAAILWTMVRVVGLGRGLTAALPGRMPWAGFPAFLGLFWLTSPMAFAYAVPYDRLYTPAAALTANLWTLVAISLWRSVLMGRVITVLTGMHPFQAMVTVLLVGDGLLLYAFLQIDVPILALMGGMTRTPEEIRMSSLVFSARAFSFLFLLLLGPLWLALFVLRRPLTWLRAAQPTTPPAGSPTRALFVGGVLAVLCGAVLLPIGQPAQQRRQHIDDLIATRAYEEALDQLSALRRADLPGQWRLAPRDRLPRDGELDLYLARHHRPVAAWVAAEVDRTFAAAFYGKNDDERVTKALQSHQDRSAVLRRYPAYLRRLADGQENEDWQRWWQAAGLDDPPALPHRSPAPALVPSATSSAFDPAAR